MDANNQKLIAGLEREHTSQAIWELNWTEVIRKIES